MENTENTGKQPEKKFRAGAISATIWNNQRTNKEGQAFEIKSIQIDRSYKDEKDEWQHTGSFRTADLPKVKLVVNKAFEFLALSDDKLKEELVA